MKQCFYENRIIESQIFYLLVRLNNNGYASYHFDIKIKSNKVLNNFHNLSCCSWRQRSWLKLRLMTEILRQLIFLYPIYGQGIANIKQSITGLSPQIQMNNRRRKSMPFIPQSDIYVIMFSLDQNTSLQNALHVWFQLSSQKQSAQYIFLGSESGKLRQCGSYNEIIKFIRNKMIKSSPNLEETQNEQSLKEIRKTIACVDDFIDESLPENVHYLEIKDYQNQAFKRVLINSIQNVISNDRQTLYSISAPISPNMMPQLRKPVSEFLQTTEYIERQEHLKSVKEKRQSEIVETIQVSYSLHIQPIQTTNNPGFLTLEQSSYSQQVEKETGFCCQLI
ncbi:unnamed protein product (macronuclear) [Paramecium tetraurelia]|uniref:Uncharacterized protein n=1 Tax=Paramecium tetraurelia TaxID=5888 RepID=A0BZB8_PARTE|nr:uncharacterized protein GSPATT00033738001 [Paramecium tetraurelia]CAK63885.1 unnamed protein product [Paramecium tetraurelia]|eukprot:XP_001431283.1 hypothetical protein (macronuclear) [Paramecium tetraurelia strain d4-2]